MDSQRRIDALTELINIGVGRGASILNTMIKKHISMRIPYIRLISVEELRSEIKKIGHNQISTVRLSFKGEISGTANLIFPPKSASKLISVIMQEEQDSGELDPIRTSTLCEIGNIVLNGIMGSISNMLKFSFRYSVPYCLEEKVDNFFEYHPRDENCKILLAHIHFRIEELDIRGDIVICFEVGSMQILINKIDEYIKNILS